MNSIIGNDDNIIEKARELKLLDSKEVVLGK